MKKFTSQTSAFAHKTRTVSLALTLAALLLTGCARTQTATIAVAPAPTDAPAIALKAPAPTVAAQPTATPPPLAAKPVIISRQSWDARPARKGMKPQTPRFITVHHTATKQSQKTSIEQKLRNLQNFSQHEGKLDGGKLKPAWPDVPYHYYIAANGKIAEGRDPRFAGDTNTDYDPVGHLLLVLEGNFENEKPTAAQTQSLAKLTSRLEGKYKIAPSQVKGHNDYASTACPGKNMKAEIKQLQGGSPKSASVATVKPVVAAPVAVSSAR